MGQRVNDRTGRYNVGGVALVHKRRQCVTHRRKTNQLALNQSDLIRRQRPRVGATIYVGRPQQAANLFQREA